MALSYWVIRSDVERVLGSDSALNLLWGDSAEWKGSSVDRAGAGTVE